ncbi:TetR/AcrR family transcriptional regulator [Nocardiopsis sp. CNT-189]|uniref:TetR/AcrR family transcriptional regulator n=1 Tax=Nocardiopsis oceanisediminis TaxID=2816862 RepID=UPI003B399970
MPSEDRTAKAAIRDAAIELFGTYGPDAVSLRAVAAAAGVSQPLIIKHFGSRHGLKEAADEHVLALAREALEPLLTGGEMADRGIAGALASTPVTRYLAYLLIGDGPHADEAFASLQRFSAVLVERMAAAGMVASGVDRERLATVMLVHDLSVALLRERIIRSLGEDPLSDTGLRQWRDLVGRLYNGTVLGPAPMG